MPEMNTIEIACDQCAATFSKSMQWIRGHDTLICRCGHHIFLDGEHFKAHIAGVTQRFDGFQEHLRNTGI